MKASLMAFGTGSSCLVEDDVRLPLRSAVVILLCLVVLVDDAAIEVPVCMGGTWRRGLLMHGHP